ncbi:MAG: hypothetical protein JWM72_889 [Actinomycetia bacterium]|nr:hypothetical protein [Actinomycetes bacterium]
MARREPTPIDKRGGYSGRPLPEQLPKAHKSPGSNAKPKSAA